jgi:hypothetical protein
MVEKKHANALPTEASSPVFFCLFNLMDLFGVGLAFIGVFNGLLNAVGAGFRVDGGHVNHVSSFLGTGIIYLKQARDAYHEFSGL